MAKAKQSQSKALVKWDEQLAKDADIAASMEASAGGGQFFSLKSGVLSWQDAPMPDNEMAVVILDHIFETTYYGSEYDADNPQGPIAFAFGRDEASLAWHESSDPEFAGKLCKDSEVCQWGTADKGRGKAAKETRRLALIPAGNFKNGKLQLIDDEQHYLETQVGFMKLPVTSVKGFAGFVKQVAGALRRPPHGIVTKVKVLPDAKTQFRVIFEPIENVPDELMGAIMKRREEVMQTIDFPYQPREEEPAKPARGGRERDSNPAGRPGGRAAKPTARATAPAKSSRRY
jgi:hypothetical protein